MANRNQSASLLNEVVSNAASAGDAVLLTTAEIYVFNKIGTTFHCRALNPGRSEWSFYSERLVFSLSIKRQRVDCSIIGVGTMLLLDTKRRLVLDIDSTQILQLELPRWYSQS